MKKTDAGKKERQGGLYWVMHAQWAGLTRGEKVARVVLKTLRFALVAAVIAAVAAVLIGAALGVFIAFGIAGAFTDGLRNASRTNTNRFYGHYKW